MCVVGFRLYRGILTTTDEMSCHDLRVSSLVVNEIFHVFSSFSCRLYRTRNLGVMILLIWLGSFGALVPTLLEIWGKFDLDKEIGSCSILPDKYGRTPKQFLFTIAFILPCCAIIICYARIFCIVRKATANLRPVEVAPPSSSSNINNHSLETESLSPDQGESITGTTFY